MSADATRRLLVVGSIALIGLVIGAATTGLPQTVASDVESVEIAVPSGPTTVRSTSTAASPVTSTPEEPPMTSETSDEEQADSSTTDAPETFPSATVEATTSTSASTSTSTSTSSSTSTPTTPAPPPSPSTTLVRPASLRVIVVNATRYPGLAGETRDVLRELGYGDVVATDAANTQVATVVYHAGERRPEAARLAEQLRVRPDAVQPKPDRRLNVDDLDGDIVIVLGADRL